MTEILSNPRSERVRAVHRLSGRSARRRAGRFIAEGPSCVREAIRTAAAEEVYLTPEAAQRYPEFLGALADHPRVRHWLVTDEVLAAMSDTVSPQGVLAVCPVPQDRIEDVLAAGPQLVVVLAHARDPGNVGTVIRAADAVGADAVILTDASVDPFNPKCVRSTTGSIFSLPVLPGPGLGEVVAQLRTAGCTVLAADGAGEVDVDGLADLALLRSGLAAPAGLGTAAAHQSAGEDVDLRRPTAWVFGNEAWGMSAPDRELADAVVRVPIHGRAESLNLAMAATVCLYASARAQRLRPGPPSASP
ncbi:MAG: TrmH family RNA methyltransferase [Actinomycetales bacterium]